MVANKKYYVDKKEMFDEIVISKEKGRCSERLGEMFYKIAEKYSHHRYFRDYERRYGKAFKEDLISAGIMACMKAWNKFDHTKFDNPFAFFTTCIYRANMGYLTREYDYSNTKNALKVNQGMRGDYGYEEMIKDGGNDVEDEEEYKSKLGIVEEAESIESGETEEITDETPTTEEEKEQIIDENRDYVVPDHLKGILLWSDEPDFEGESELKSQTVNDMFGIQQPKEK